MVRRAAALAGAALLAAGAGARAQEVRAWLEPETIALGQTADLVISVEIGGVRGAVEEPRLPDLENLRVMGRSRESRVSMSGAKITRTSIWRYTIMPVAPGAITIGPVRVVSGGRAFATDPLRILVVPSGGAPPRLAREPVAGGTPPVFASTRVDRARAWVGQQITLTFSFYHDPTHPLAESPDYDPPDVPGFWRMEIDKEPIVSLERIGGRAYNVQRFRYALFPLRAGELVVGPARVQIVEPDAERWWEPGRGRTVETDPIRVQVDSLPPAPAGFAGAVGRYDLQGTARPRETAVGTPIELELTVRGTGNPNAVGPPTLPEWPDIEVRAPSVEAKIEPAAEGVHGEKTFRFLLVPATEGALSLGIARLPYFDPATGSYRADTLRLGEIVVAAAPSGGAPRASAREARGPVLWAARAPLARRGAGGGPAEEPWAWAALGVPWAAWLLAAGMRAARARRGRGSSREALARLSAASRTLEASGGPAALAEAERALDEALARSFGAGAAAGTPRERTVALAVGGAPEEVVRAVEAARAALAEARFAGAPGRSGAPSGVGEAARALRAVAERLGRNRARGGAGLLAVALATALLAGGGGAHVVRAQPGAPPVASTPEAAQQAWQAANEAYRAGDFTGAAQHYGVLLESWADPRLEADLGAALWRGGAPGEGYAHYLHALALDPGAGAVRGDAARLRAELGAPPDARGPMTRALGRVTRSGLLGTALALDALALALFLRSRRRPAARTTRALAWVAASLVVALAGAALLRAAMVERPTWAVVAERAPVRAGAGDQAPAVASLPAGSVARVLEPGETAWRIRAPGRPAGWVARDRIVPLHSRGPHTDRSP